MTTAVKRDELKEGIAPSFPTALSLARRLGAEPTNGLARGGINETAILVDRRVRQIGEERQLRTLTERYESRQR